LPLLGIVPQRGDGLIRIRAGAGAIAIIPQGIPGGGSAAGAQRIGRHMGALLVQVQAQLLQLQVVGDELLLLIIQLT